MKEKCLTFFVISFLNFTSLCRIVCLLTKFEVRAWFHPKCKFSIVGLWHLVFNMVSFLNALSFKCGTSLENKLIWCSLRNFHIFKLINIFYRYNMIYDIVLWTKFSYKIYCNYIMTAGTTSLTTPHLNYMEEYMRQGERERAVRCQSIFYKYKRLFKLHQIIFHSRLVTHL